MTDPFQNAVNQAAEAAGNRQQQIRLPEVLRFVVPAQHAVFILHALNEVSAPAKDSRAVIQNFEQQIMAQQLKAEYTGTLPGAPIPVSPPAATPEA